MRANRLPAVIAASLECFQEKPSWCRNEQGLSGVKCTAL